MDAEYDERLDERFKYPWNRDEENKALDEFVAGLKSDE